MKRFFLPLIALVGLAFAVKPVMAHGYHRSRVIVAAPVVVYHAPQIVAPVIVDKGVAPIRVETVSEPSIAAVIKPTYSYGSLGVRSATIIVRHRPAIVVQPVRSVRHR